VEAGSLSAPFKLTGEETTISLDLRRRNQGEDKPLVKISAIWSLVDMN
jgi:hypothetical protein